MKTYPLTGWSHGIAVFIVSTMMLIQPTVRGVDVVKDGQALATIIIDELAVVERDAPKGKKGAAKPARGSKHDDAFAADVLVNWIEKITGSKLPIARTAPADRLAIYVGTAAVKAGLKLDAIESPSHEGVRIVVENNRILIAGQTCTGGESESAPTIKAVCRFLEELGCRYFMDSPLGEVYPTSKTLSVAACDISEAPGFMYRNPKGPSWLGAQSVLWRIWNGQGGVIMNHAHSWGNYVPNSLADAHPDFFAMGADGNRVAKGWLCTSNPALRTYFADQVLARIKAGNLHPSLSPTDGRGYCQCAACKAQDHPNEIEPSSGTLSMAPRYVDFFNSIGAKVAQQSPESILSFYCYADYTQPPEGVTCAPNLCAFIAPIRYCRLHSMDNPMCASCQQEKTMIEGWAKAARKIGYYEYNYDLAEATVPTSRLSILKHDIPYLKHKGCVALTIETLSNWHIYGPQIYLAVRLAYAPNVNADAIMDDYFMKFFGPNAGPIMKEYWMGIDAAQAKLNCHSGSFFAIPLLYTPDFLAQCRERIKRATDAAATDPRYAARVAVHAEGFKSADEYMQIVNAMNVGNFAEAKSVYTKMIARLDHLAGEGYANKEYATSYLRRFVSKSIDIGAAATSAPNKLVSVLPDELRMTYDDPGTGLDTGFAKPDFDDSAWKRVATFSKSLDAQGLPDKMSVMWYRTTITAPAQRRKLALVFTQVDGASEVFVNGIKVGESLKRNLPFEVDISTAVHDGTNSIAVRVDHTRMTELFLGGIIRPVLLVEKE